jgi:hypothetical protein
VAQPWHDRIGTGELAGKQRRCGAQGGGRDHGLGQAPDCSGWRPVTANSRHHVDDLA